MKNSLNLVRSCVRPVPSLEKDPRSILIFFHVTKYRWTVTKSTKIQNCFPFRICLDTGHWR